MPITVVNGGLQELLDTLAALMEGGYRLGLYQNAVVPAQALVAADLTPADFSGYAGLVTLSGVTAAVQDGVRWKIGFDTVAFVHNGGLTPNNIYGFYVVDSGGVLQWLQPADFPPRPMSNLGDTYSVDPRFTDRSEF